MGERVVIASLVVQARPTGLAGIADHIAAMSGAEIHASDPAGKLIVVLELDSDGGLADATHRIGDIAGVLSVNLVFHHTEAGTDSADGGVSPHDSKSPEGATV